MRHQTRKFIHKFLDEKGAHNYRTVLDVGSRNISGSSREDFQGLLYTGVDMLEGDNVDVVVNGHDLSDVFEDETFDIVACFDTLEHDDKFWLTVDAMKRVLKKDGYLLIGVPSRNCPLHQHPKDYWRFMEDSFIEYFFKGYKDLYIDVQREDTNQEVEDEIYGWGRKT